MAVFTPLTEKDIQAVTDEYGLGPLESVRPIAEGTENTLYRVDTTEKTFVLTLYETSARAQADHLPVMMAFQSHLKAQGIPCPTPLETPGGDTYTTCKNKPVALWPFLQGTTLEEKNIRDPHCHIAGVLMAQCHLAATDFPLSTSNSLSLKNLKQLHKSCEKKASDAHLSLTHTLGQQLNYLSDRPPYDLPQAMIHADYCYDNLLFTSEGAALIDFGFCCEERFLYDLALALNSFGFDEAGLFRPTRFHRFLSGYESVRPLTLNERKCFNEEMRRSAARICATRLYDALHPPKTGEKANRKPDPWFARLDFHIRRHELADYS